MLTSQLQKPVTSRTKRFAIVCTSLPHGSWVVHGRGCGSRTVLGQAPLPASQAGPPRRHFIIKHALPRLCNCARHTHDMFDNHLGKHERNGMEGDNLGSQASCKLDNRDCASPDGALRCLSRGFLCVRADSLQSCTCVHTEDR